MKFARLEWTACCQLVFSFLCSMMDSISDLHAELWFKAARSGGKGGQNVNKVSSKIELYFDIKGSRKLDDTQKVRLLEKMAGRINQEGILLIDSQESRSQLENRKIAIRKFDSLVRQALTERKKRIASKPSAAAKAKRLEEKRRQSEKKQQRSNRRDD